MIRRGDNAAFESVKGILNVIYVPVNRSDRYL